MFHRLLLAAALSALGLFGAPVAAQGVGTSMPSIPLERFQQTDATSLEDFYGRAILFEFFAHW